MHLSPIWRHLNLSIEHMGVVLSGEMGRALKHLQAVRGYHTLPSEIKFLAD